MNTTGSAAGRPPRGGWRDGFVTAPEGDRAATGLLVIKLGGSLLARPGWPDLVRDLAAAEAARPRCLVVGGGAVVDGLRAIERSAPLPTELAHDLAIEAMRLTARLVSALTGVPLAAAPVGSGAAVLDVPAWLAADGGAERLPAGWHVTSDSIAARVAIVHHGGLLLAKSVPPPCPARLDRLAAAGWVDEYFPTAAVGLAEIRWAAPAD